MLSSRSDIGALKETIQDAGVLIDVKPGSEDYIQRFIQETDHLLNHPELIKKLGEAGEKRAKSLTWEKSAHSMINYLINFQHLG